MRTHRDRVRDAPLLHGGHPARRLAWCGGKLDNSYTIIVLTIRNMNIVVITIMIMTIRYYIILVSIVGLARAGRVTSRRGRSSPGVLIEIVIIKVIIIIKRRIVIMTIIIRIIIIVIIIIIMIITIIIVIKVMT